jgi:SAM-dependent methyltransferase
VAELGVFDRLCGVEISLEAIEAARAAAPRAELHVARLDALPFDAETFDLVVMNDVLQHVHEDEVTPGLSEVRRVLRPAGALFVRTNGARRARREREDWRVYDAATLERELTAAGLAVKRITYANTLFSLWGSVRGRTPRAPTETWAGHPQRSGKLAAALGRRVLAAEARYLRDTRRRLPYGHTLLAVAVRLPGDDSMPADPPSAR